MGGCWCTYFHQLGDAEQQRKELGNRAFKEAPVADGKTHAALVFDGSVAVAWCQYGPGGGATEPSSPARSRNDHVNADYPITCLLVDYDHAGVTTIAVQEHWR